MAAGLRTIILAGLVVGGVDGFVLPDLKLDDVLSVRTASQERSAPTPSPFLAHYTQRQLPSETRPMPMPGRRER